MIKRLSPFNITEKEQLQLDLAGWILDSHYWIEYHPGYFECKWCRELHTSNRPVTVDYTLCPENPSLKRFIEHNIGDYLDPKNELC